MQKKLASYLIMIWLTGCSTIDGDFCLLYEYPLMPKADKHIVEYMIKHNRPAAEAIYNNKQTYKRHCK